MIKTDIVEIFNRVKSNIETVIENKSLTSERDWKIYLIVYTANHTLYIFDAYDSTILYKK